MTIVSIHTIRVAILLFVVMLSARVSAAQYQVQSWTTDNGLPHNIVQSLHQTRDGYIWMATFDGLVRFDGVRFTVFNRSNSPGIRNNRFICLYESADGAIWACTEGGGVTRYDRGSCTTYTTQDGLTNDHVLSITGDAAGNVWVLSGRQIMHWGWGAVPAAARSDVAVLSLRLESTSVVGDRSGAPPSIRRWREQHA